jgi:hypothetical protein
MGNVTVGAELETSSLPGADGRRVEAALARLPWGRPAGPPPHPDAFRFEISLPERPDRGIAVLEEGELGGDLAPLLERFRVAGAPEPPRRRGGGG